MGVTPKNRVRRLAIGLMAVTRRQRFGSRGCAPIHSKARAAIRLTTKRLLRPKLVEFFHASPSLYARWNVTLNMGPFSVSWRQMLALTAPWRIWWTGWFPDVLVSEEFVDVCFFMMFWFVNLMLAASTAASARKWESSSFQRAPCPRYGTPSARKRRQSLSSAATLSTSLNALLLGGAH